jgi:hypothetical protein
MLRELAHNICDSLSEPSSVLEKARTEYKQDRTGPLASGLAAATHTLCSAMSYPMTTKLFSDEIDAMDIPAGVETQHRILTKFLLLSPSEPSGQDLLGDRQFGQVKAEGGIISWKPDVAGNHVFVAA